MVNIHYNPQLDLPVLMSGARLSRPSYPSDLSYDSSPFGSYDSDEIDSEDRAALADCKAALEEKKKKQAAAIEEYKGKLVAYKGCSPYDAHLPLADPKEWLQGDHGTASRIQYQGELGGCVDVLRIKLGTGDSYVKGEVAALATTINIVTKWAQLIEKRFPILT